MFKTCIARLNCPAGYATEHERKLREREIVWKRLNLSCINTALSQSAFRSYKCYIIICISTHNSENLT